LLGATTEVVGACFGVSSLAGVESSPSGFVALVSIRQTTAPTSTASPSSALRVIVPLTSAGSSSVALSLSTSAMAWSFST